MNNLSENSPFIVTEYAVYSKKNSIVYITFKKNLILNLDTAKKIVRERLKFQADTTYPVICDVTAIRSIDENARMYLASIGSHQLTAVALVSLTPTLYEMGTYYKEFDTPKSPTEVFSSIEAAEEYMNGLTRKP